MDKIKNNKDMEINKNINDFDSAIKEKVVNENRTIPKEVSDRIDKTLSELPERKSGVTDTQVENKEKHNYMLYTGVAAACIVFSLVFLLPNVSIAYAKTMAEIPVIGDIIKVVTIRDYKYEDKNHEMDIKVPKVEGKDKNKESVEYINKDVKELTDILIKQFYDDLKTEGSNSTVKVDNEVVTNNNKWFTLKLTVMEISASSNTYYKYYHIDKKDGKIVYLEELLKDESYLKIITEEIKRQMKEQMKKDENVVYWIDDDLVESFTDIDGKHNFYFDEKGRLVIPFDKYEVAPGYMGCPEFTIEKSILNINL